MKTLLTILLSISMSAHAVAQKQAKPVGPVAINKGQVVLTADQRGNQMLDFSYCGYRQQADSIPSVPVKVFVSHRGGDQSQRLQQAIDYVSSLKPDKRTGMRGAVLIAEGEHELSQPLRIAASGVVLRGVNKKTTVLRKTGVDRGAVIYIEGRNDLRVLDTLRLKDDYVPVSSHRLTLQGNTSVSAGTPLIIVRPSTKEWIESIGCSVFGGNLPYWGWKPGEMDVRWQRTVVTAAPSGTGTAVQIDAPLSVSLDQRWGGAYAMTYTWPGLVTDCGVENLTIESAALSPRDENHAWDGVYIDAAQDCWVRLVDFRSLAGSAVIVQRMAQQVTVEDCRSFSPASEVGGWRRRTFITMGGKTLFQRCYSEYGINDFSAGYCAPGPNAFVQCEAERSHGMSGSCGSWATGLLFDGVNIDRGSISFKNLELDNWGSGWNTANSVMWQCAASKLDCYSPSADAQCYAVGCWGYCQGNGFWLETNNHITSPRSLFHYQLTQRIGEAADSRCRVLMRNLDGSTSPTIERAAEMAREALQPRITMSQWADQAVLNASVSPDGAKQLPEPRQSRMAANVHTTASAMTVSDGRLTFDGALMSGFMHRTPWWNGRTRYPYMDKATFAVTRFVPGYEQRGGTDRIDSLAANIQRLNVAVWNQNYGLWYDRRRDDHERVSRTDGNVWPPFYEQAIARSGRGTSWDGLSLYDLSSLNTWYYHRINQLADAAPSMLIINQHYFQHNILEAGAHWVDAPWRSVNNIQSTGQNQGRGTQFLEPVPFTGDKRIFTADLFYDTTCAERANLYRQYIWNVLDATADAPNVYQSVSEEYTGPAHFVEFWLDCIAQWQQKTGRKARVVLNATRDVTSSVMAQAKYADLVDIVQIEQWYYHGQKLYAPEGGKNLAPRQHLRLTRTGNPDFADVYRSVSEAVKAYPGKAVLYHAKGFERSPWAVVFAGGSCPMLKIADQRLAQALPQMQPEAPAAGVYKMSSDRASIILNHSAADIELTTAGKVYRVNQREGTLTPHTAKTIGRGEMVFVVNK